MKIILPDQIKVIAEKIEGNKWKLNYMERFPKADREAWETAKKILTEASKSFAEGRLKVRSLKNGLNISLVGTREEVYDCLVSEFLPRSTIGKKTLGEIFDLLAVMTGIASPEKLLKLVPSSLPQPGIVGELRKEDSKEVS